MWVEEWRMEEVRLCFHVKIKNKMTYRVNDFNTSQRILLTTVDKINIEIILLYNDIINMKLVWHITNDTNIAAHVMQNKMLCI